MESKKNTKKRTLSIRKIAMAGVLVAVAVAGSLISFPVAGSKCAPVQHMVNICAAVFLGPVWGVGVAFCASIIRNLTGLGSLMAFPGSMVGALCCGLMYRFSKKIIPTCIAEALGTGILGGLAAYPLAKYVMLIQPEGMFIYIVPFYVLGPLVTDIAPGYDHITAAIGGAVAAMNGAAFLCYVTPAEHLALPNVEDTKQGIIASKIAAHAADIAKGIPGARDIDDKMADARRVLDWDAQFACALDPETAKAIRDDRLPEDDHSEACSMCGKFCAVRSMNKALAGEYIDIL